MLQFVINIAKGVAFLYNKCIILEIIKEDYAKENIKKDKGKRKSLMCLAAANEIIIRTNAQNEWRTQTKRDRVQLTGKRLQKLLYLSQLFWFMDHDESKMITESFQAWPNGPVIPEIYEHFSVYQDGDMCPLLHMGHRELNNDEKSLIDRVVDNTIDIPTEAIIDYTHTEGSPWAQVYQGGRGVYGIISSDSIKQYICDPNHQNELFNFIQDGKKYGSC